MKDSILFTNHPLDLTTLLARTTEEEHGAQVIFTGTIRRHNQGRKVVRLSYDVFQALAFSKIEDLIKEAQEKWGKDLRIWVQQRIGDLEVGEIGIFIVVSAPHRDEAYQASRHMIEGIKHTVPIWKKEYYEDGQSDWVEGHSLCSHQEVTP